jgi:AraC-like DNA-binding protein
VAAYVDEHYAERLTLDRLAKQAGISSYYLTTLFRRCTGRSVMAYVGDVRHREARSLLSNTGLAVTEVARSVGYDDPYYFSRVFRSREGCAPSAYRRAFQPPAAALDATEA